MHSRDPGHRGSKLRDARRSVLTAAGALAMVVAMTAIGTACGDDEAACHPAYEPCLPNRSGDVIDCSDLASEDKPVRVKEIGVAPYFLDADRNGRGCEFEVGKLGDLIEGLTE